MKELKSLFDTMEKVLPIGLREWEVVLEQHNKIWSAKEREVRGLRQKFNRLNASKLPTGDPNCPWDVKWAKQLKRKIDEKADSNLLNDVSEAEDEVEDDDTPEDDDEEEEDNNNTNNNTSSSSSDDLITPMKLNNTKDNFGRTISSHMSRNKNKRKYTSKTNVPAVVDTSSAFTDFMQMQMVMEKQKEAREEKRRQAERQEDRRREDRMMMMMMAVMSGNKTMMERSMMMMTTTKERTNNKENNNNEEETDEDDCSGSE